MMGRRETSQSNGKLSDFTPKRLMIPAELHLYPREKMVGGGGLLSVDIYIWSEFIFLLCNGLNI